MYILSMAALFRLQNNVGKIKKTTNHLHKRNYVDFPHVLQIRNKYSEYLLTTFTINSVMC